MNDMDLALEVLKNKMKSWQSRSFLDWVRCVYGGFIGKKLSQDSPVEVWEALQKLGVTQIIDLRYDYDSEIFRSRCKKFGFSYYNYPIHNDAKTIVNMVEHFYDFCDLIYNGSFYMLGRTNSSIALCVYWIFGNYKGHNYGLYPLELVDEIRTNDRIMKKALPILYAIIKFKEECSENTSQDNSYINGFRERIQEFKDNPYPPKLSFSIIDFTRDYRNKTVVYDISIQDIGVVGYLYAPNLKHGLWEYDIVLLPSVSDNAKSFEDSQIGIARHLCNILPMSIKWATLPESVKMSISLLRDSLDR